MKRTCINHLESERKSLLKLQITTTEMEDKHRELEEEIKREQQQLEREKQEKVKMESVRRNS